MQLSKMTASRIRWSLGETEAAPMTKAACSRKVVPKDFPGDGTLLPQEAEAVQGGFQRLGDNGMSLFIPVPGVRKVDWLIWSFLEIWGQINQRDADALSQYFQGRKRPFKVIKCFVGEVLIPRKVIDVRWFGHLDSAWNKAEHHPRAGCFCDCIHLDQVGPDLGYALV